jgi:UPF0716 protein FxsA
VGKLLLLFILVPLLDAWLLFKVAGVLGFVETLALVIFTGVLGAWLFKLEGTRTWGKWQQSLAEGRMPEEGVLGGVMLLLGGALLVTPGVITDAVGLLLLLPPTRRLIAKLLRPRLKRLVKDKATRVVESPNVRVVTFGFGGERTVRREPGHTEVVGKRIPAGDDAPRRREVIDADFEVKPD